MAKRTDPPVDAQDTPDTPDTPDTAGNYVPLSGARTALQKLLDNPEFRKTAAAVDVAYALGALEEDVDGGIARDARVRERKQEALQHTIEIAHLIAELVPQWLKLFGSSHDMGPPIVSTPPTGARRCMANPSNLDVWVCCQCLAKATLGTPVAMITDGDACPVCQHTRCDVVPIVG